MFLNDAPLFQGHVPTLPGITLHPIHPSVHLIKAKHGERLD